MSLRGEDRKRMLKEQRKIEEVYVFGKDNYNAFKSVKIPCSLGGIRFWVNTEVVKGDLPWLIGRETMERMGVEINLGEQKVTFGEIEGRCVSYYKKGEMRHIKVDLLAVDSDSKEWFSSRQSEWMMIKEGRKRKLLKLHLQLGHGSWEKVIKLIRNEYGGREGVTEDKIKEIK